MHHIPGIGNKNDPMKMFGHHHPFVQFDFITYFGGFHPFIRDNFPGVILQTGSQI